MNKKEKKLQKKRIVSFLAQKPQNKFKSKEIARALKIKSADYVKFRNLLRKLSEEGILIKAGRNSYQLNKKPSLQIGTLRVKSQGYGFVELHHSDRELFISQRNMADALDGDLVAVQLFAQSKRGLLPEGRIDRVLERKRNYIVGTFKKGKYFNFVDPDDLKIPWDIIVHDHSSQNAQPGQKVVVTIEYWEDRGLNPTGKIVEILGYPEDTGVDITSVLYAYNLPTSFPSAVEKEANQIFMAIQENTLKGRLDLRDINCFTIDPADAKDYDDAVSLEQIEGAYRLGVHIADVSYYVKEGSKIDKEALKRGTSVYLVDRVIPMLPEILSNQTCSLKPNEDRLTYSVLIDLDENSQVLGYQIKPSVIRSKRRFTYEEVMDILDSGRGDFYEELNQMCKLSQILYQRRIKSGSLDFETPEIKIDMDKSGHPISIRRKVRLESHQLIEEFMLLANKIIAEHIALKIPSSSNHKRKWPFVYRVHERPTQEKITAFVNLAKTLGFNLKSGKRIQSKNLFNVLHQAKGKPEEDIINQVLLRSLMKAKYETRNVGHFGLAFQYYTHFTSPIRRYPDLIVHRLLKEYEKQPSPDRFSQLKHALPDICRISTDQEINAQEAERRSIKIKQAEFMVDKLGEIYEGIISGIVAFGIFVEITDFLVDGLVHVKDLGSDYYIHDESNYRLIGKTTGKVYRLGDRVKVQVIRVNPGECLIDFQLIDLKDF
jgi:ribonuclease R